MQWKTAGKIFTGCFPWGVECGTARNQWYRCFVEVGSDIIFPTIGTKQNQLKVRCHWHYIEVAPVKAYRIEIIGHIVTSWKMHQGKQWH